MKRTTAARSTWLIFVGVALGVLASWGTFWWSTAANDGGASASDHVHANGFCIHSDDAQVASQVQSAVLRAVPALQEAQHRVSGVFEAAGATPLPAFERPSVMLNCTDGP